MRVQLITPATEEPVSLEEVKLHCRIDGDADNLLLQSLITAVRRHGEALTRRVFIRSDWELRFSGPFSEAQEIPVNPGAECVAVLVDGVTVDPVHYVFTPSALHPQESPLCALLEPAETFPDGDAIAVTVRAGWSAGSFPADIKAWMLVRISTLYEQRESIATGTVTELSHGFVDCLLDAYRIPGGM